MDKTTIVQPEFMHLHKDFTILFAFVKVRYIRNVLRWNYDFSKSRLFMTKFDYVYANENDCIPNFKKMQSECRIFESKYKNGNWDFRMENKYVHFLIVSIKEIINNLMIPIGNICQDCMNIKYKYRENEYLFGPQFEDDTETEEDDDEDDDNDKENNDKSEI
jgi:hypothetical protein